jgi:hypothetical protein
MKAEQYTEAANAVAEAAGYARAAAVHPCMHGFPAHLAQAETILRSMATAAEAVEKAERNLVNLAKGTR